MTPRRLGNKLLRRLVDTAKDMGKERRFAAASADYDLNGYRRIYLVHIRKTAGTSINRMFLSLSGEDPDFLYQALSDERSHRLISNGLGYVGWNRRHINRGHYFYAFSHTPLHRLKLPPQTFSLSCFRDPAQRVISHYRMLMEFRLNGTQHPCMATEGCWLGNSFSDFLKNIPKEHLLNQLYMFSRRLDVDEAVANVAHLSDYLFVDEFDSGISRINRRTGLRLSPVHIRKSTFQLKASESELEQLRSLVDDEYVFLDRIRSAQKGT